MSSRYKYPAAADNAHFQQQKSMFLPIILCSKSSIKDFKISHHCRGSSSSDNHTDNKSAPPPKLKRFFSTKILPTKSNPTPKDSKSRRNYVRSHCQGDSCNVGVSQLMNLSDLDPPLPIVRPPPSQLQLQQGSGQPRVRENLWKRRSGEATLKSLQLQSIHGGAPNLQCVEAKTV